MTWATQLNGCHALVTGGSKGIGRAIVQALAAEGCTVSYCARNIGNSDFESPLIHGTSVDVGKREDLVEWVEKSADKFGRLDIVVANASVMEFESTPEIWQNTFSIDLMGFVSLVETAIPFLEKSPQASIININSVMGREFFRSPPAPYGPLKAAQLQHVQELSHFLGVKQIRVNAVSPGPILFEGGAWEQYSQMMPEWVEQKRQSIPMKRLGRPEEIANVVVFLASPLSSFVQGANILADGGLHIGTAF